MMTLCRHFPHQTFESNCFLASAGMAAHMVAAGPVNLGMDSMRMVPSLGLTTSLPTLISRMVCCELSRFPAPFWHRRVLAFRQSPGEAASRQSASVRTGSAGQFHGNRARLAAREPKRRKTAKFACTCRTVTLSSRLRDTPCRGIVNRLGFKYIKPSCVKSVPSKTNGHGCVWRVEGGVWQAATVLFQPRSADAAAVLCGNSGMLHE